MPTIFRHGPYRFYFFSHEPNEPPHVHVDRDASSAKFWLQSVALARSVGFSAKELGEISRIVRAQQSMLEEAWHGYFGNQRG
jgi:5-enolpyruvylshikimate-3-phosphate synthase